MLQNCYIWILSHAFRKGKTARSGLTHSKSECCFLYVLKWMKTFKCSTTFKASLTLDVVVSRRRSNSIGLNPKFTLNGKCDFDNSQLALTLTAFRMDADGIVNVVEDIDLKLRSTSPSNDMLELMASLDMNLGYSSEKLVNLDLFIAVVYLGESELNDISLGNNAISEVEIEKALVFDLSFGYLDSEVTELGHFLNVLQTKIYDAHQNLCLYKQRIDVFEPLQEKLASLESSWKHSQEQVLEMKKQLLYLHRTISIIRPETSYSLEDEAFEGSGLDLGGAEQQRLVLRMLEKSLAGELDLEKQLLDAKDREEELKSKLFLTNNVLSNSEAFSETALVKLLEAECSAEILLGIAKEKISLLQILHFNVNCSVHREGELKLKLSCTNEALSNMEELQEVSLRKLLAAESSSEIFTSITKEMIPRLQILQFNHDCSIQREERLKTELLCTNEGASKMEAFSEVLLERLLVSEHSSEIFAGIGKEMMSHLQVLQFNLHGSIQRERRLKSDLLRANELASRTELYSEVLLERQLELEYSSDIFLGITKELVSRLQLLQFNLDCSVQKEGELESKLQAKEMALIKAEENNLAMKHHFEENETLAAKQLEAVEEKLHSSESKLQGMKVAYESSQEQVSMMEEKVRSLGEHVFKAESRADEAEAKLKILTEENMELREEVGFLKGGDSNEKKISLLEKQVGELEMQVQNARLSSETSLDQQNMLYTAIWDMETLIEELKSKVFKAESSAETNLELNEEISSLKAENKKLRESLKETNSAKDARVKEINNGTELITEMVMQLAVERERIQKQLSTLARENKVLKEALQKARTNGAIAQQDSKDDVEKLSS